jgi:hypothetical protein
MASPHLLGIPRELRNIIYDYLFEWETVDDWHCEVPWRSDPLRAEIRLKSAPLSNVLLANSQLHDEYLESAVFRSPTIELRILRLEGMDMDSYQGRERKICSALTFARDVTLFIRIEDPAGFVMQPIWRPAQSLGARSIWRRYA